MVADYPEIGEVKMKNPNPIMMIKISAKELEKALEYRWIYYPSIKQFSDPLLGVNGISVSEILEKIEQTEGCSITNKFGFPADRRRVYKIDIAE